MQMDYFKYLVDIAETKSISQTAERFYLTHQAISKAIKKVEDDFSVNLLIRTRKGVELTDAGKLFIKKSYEILENYKDLNELLEPFRIPQKQTLKGELEILTIPKFLEINLPSLITNFYSKFPTIKVSFKTDTHNNILNNYEFNNYTIGIITLIDFDLHNENFLRLLEQKDLKVESLLSSKSLVLMHKNSKWAEYLNYEDLEINKVPRIHFGYTVPSNIFSHDYHGNYIVSTMASMRKLVLNKQGVGLLSQFEYEKHFPKSTNIIVKQIDEGINPPLHYAYIIRKQDSIPLYLDKFISILKKAFAG